MGCESCHGPGSAHLAATTPEDRKKSIQRLANAATCGTCHTAATSPKFKLEEAKQKGVHVLAAAPAEPSK